MKKIALNSLSGIHPDFARVERELDLAPARLPDRALLPIGLAQQINQVYPLVVIASGELFCIGQTSLYRWLSAHMPSDMPVVCQVWPGKLTKELIYQMVLTDRLVAPALAQITPQQVRDLYVHIAPPQAIWPHAYRSHAHLSRLAGVKPLNGASAAIGGDE